MGEENELKDINIFIKMSHEKQYIDKIYISEVEGNFNEIFAKQVKTKVEDIELKKKGE